MPMGQFNSSVTRVGPIFEELFAKNGTDASWVLQLWDLAKSSDAANRPQSAGAFDPQLLATNPKTGIRRTFEVPIPPPVAFLRWLILNPDRMSPPTGDTFGTLEDGLARKQRRELFSADRDVREAAQKVAISELDRAGARGSARKWWAFEGFTHTTAIWRPMRFC